MRFVRRLLCALVAIAAAMVLPATAQQFSFADLPVLEAKPDFNGVDPGTGGYATQSPLTLGAPGAGHLNVRAWFNTMVFTFSLNIYLIDDTYTPGGGDPSERHVRIHFGGVDNLFTCHVGASCVQVGEVDGTALTRTGPDTYVFRDRDGAAYNFFPLTYLTLTEACSDYETGCNAAGYQASAYVSTVVYPSGEKLTYQPYRVVQNNSNGTVNTRDTIVSNLGYKLDVERFGISPPTVSLPAGQHWFAHRDLSYPLTMSLYRDSTLISALTANTVFTNQNQNRTTTLTDSANRVYQVDMLTYTVNTPCTDTNGFPLIYRKPLPVRVVSPAGVETNIAYHTQLSANHSNTLPVSTVTQGGHSWTYDNVATGKTLTTPGNKTRTVASAWYADGWDHGVAASFCSGQGMGQVGYKITSVKDELSYSSSYDYYWNSTVKLKSATLPESNGYKYEFDGRGNLTKITQVAKPSSGLAERIVFQADYDPTCGNPVTCNKPNWVKDGKQNQTDYTYDPVHGGIATATLPADSNGVRPQTRYIYTPFNTGDGTIYRLFETYRCITGASCANSADEHKTTTTYWNKTFLPWTITESVGDGSVSVVTSFDYDAAGHPTQFTNERGYTTYFFYDAVGRKVGEISADPDAAGPLPRLATRTTYNHDDQVTKVERGTATGTSVSALDAMSVHNVVETFIDTAGRRYKQEIKVGGVTQSLTQFSYDVEERLECSAVRMNPGAFSASALPSSACALGAEGDYGPDRITRHLYSATGDLTTIQKAYQTPLQQDYATYGYSANGKRTSAIDAKGNKSKFEYDGYDRQTHWYFPSKTATGQFDASDYEQYGYDANDNRSSLRKRDARTIVFGYDALNRMTLKDIPLTTTGDVYYGYDLRGLQRYARFGSASGQGVTSTYDGIGRLLSTTTNLGGTSRMLSYLPDESGNRKRLTFPDGNYFVYVYDGLDRMTGIQENGSTTVASLSYDALGRRATLSGGIDTSYEYSGVARLSSLTHDLSGTAQDVTFGLPLYNPANQIITRTRSNESYAWAPTTNAEASYVANGQNQYTSAAGATLGYDVNGNLTSNGGVTLGYDVENRLVSATGSKTAALSYDPLGRLYETSGGSAGQTRFLFDGDALVAEYDSAGNLLNRYVHGPGSDEPLLWYEGGAVSSASRNVLRADHQGSIVALASSAGVSRGINRYDGYGVAAGSIVGRFAFTGQLLIPELDLYHYKARMYSAALGRFLQTDPVGYEDDLNLYAYVRNDPLNLTDPTGMAPPGCGDGNCFTWSDFVEGMVDSTEGADMKRLRSETDYRRGVFSGLGLEALAGLAKAKQERGGRGPVLKGQEGVERALAELKAQGYQVISSKEVKVVTANGTRKYDAILQDTQGALCGLECKNGPSAAKRSNQKARDAEVNRGDPNKAVGGNARAAGIEGQKIDKVIDICYDASGKRRPC